MVMALILHVNGDDAEAVVHATRIAIEFRQTFGVDVVLIFSATDALGIMKAMSHLLPSL